MDTYMYNERKGSKNKYLFMTREYMLRSKGENNFV